FRRIVRDVAQQLGKDIELTISGADTELDKSLVEQIADPLTHLVRNAIDHGIESSEQRIAAGKPARGHIRLDAHHEAGNVIIEVSDDGGGLKREAILAKARQKGLIAADANPPDSEVWQLIFEPGFSTAQQVSDLSGRGVGMDVVRRNIEALRGSIEIESKPGQGSSFRICLPLTLAIIGGFLVRVAGVHYVAPLDNVIECLDLGRDDTGNGFFDLRGQAMPLLDLRRHFQLDGSRARRRSVLVVAVGKLRAGLVVDSLEGELQAVIKPLGPLFSRLSGIAGSTILGSGAVALVLDMPSLLHDATASPTR
ncbi:MAG TPA: chemotaxis protein CheA, partial [Arenimonas sp.]|nr:chemotaxis protein CheA [Arenimonas sp.]